jgi:prepilin-type N-terminal cleavage/methylation domain-containing protein
MNRRAGFTLIEMIVAITVLAIMGGVAIEGGLRVTDLNRAATITAHRAMDVDAALVRIARDIENASAITPAPGRLAITRTGASLADCASCVDRSADVVYVLDRAAGRLSRSTVVGAHPLLDDVADFSVTLAGPGAGVYTVVVTLGGEGKRVGYRTGARPLALVDPTGRQVLP